MPDPIPVGAGEGGLSREPAQPDGGAAPRAEGEGRGPAVSAAEFGYRQGGGVRALLRDYGLRYSRPREAILTFLRERSRHVGAEALYQALRERGEDLSLSTVYLNLGVLVEAGLLHEFKGANGESLYDASIEPHLHLICSETGEVVDVPMPTVGGSGLATFLAAYVERITGWVVEEVHLSLQGRRRERRACADGGEAGRSGRGREAAAEVAPGANCGRSGASDEG